MLWDSGNMGKTNEGMWNSSSHAMNDVSALAYRRNVPASGLIVPAGVDTKQTSETIRDKMYESNLGDVSWNQLGTGRGRGALLQNRDFLHRNDQELKKQLRLANELGYSNDLIEARFQNSSPPRSLDGKETAEKVVHKSFYKEDDLTSINVDVSSGPPSPEKEDTEEEDMSIKENGEWNWEKRTAEPPCNRVILRNVALQSLKRQKQKAKPAEEVSSDVVFPAASSATPKVKEDWRAENKAAEEIARRSQGAEGDVFSTHSKAKKGWRSGVCDEPLLGNLKIDANWSIFAPSVTPPLVAEDSYNLHVSLPTLEPGQQTVAIESPPKSLLESSCLDVPQKGKKKGKKNKNVRVMYVPPALRTYPEPNIAPPGYLMPTNGVPPMAIRNTEYNPLAGQNIHQTFGNLFEKTIKLLGTSNHNPYKRCDEFSLASDQFPRLK